MANDTDTKIVATHVYMDFVFGTSHRTAGECNVVAYFLQALERSPKASKCSAILNCYKKPKPSHKTYTVTVIVSQSEVNPYSFTRTVDMRQL